MNGHWISDIIIITITIIIIIIIIMIMIPEPGYDGNWLSLGTKTILYTLCILAAGHGQRP